MTKRNLDFFDAFTGDELSEDLTFDSSVPAFSRSEEHNNRFIYGNNEKTEKSQKSKIIEDI